MPISVSDARSNPEDQIAHAAKVIGRSNNRARVFKAICFGKKQVKSVEEIAQTTGLSRKQVLNEGKRLVHNQLTTQTKKGRDTAYAKDGFYGSRAQAILRLAASLTEPHPSVHAL